MLDAVALSKKEAATVHSSDVSTRSEWDELRDIFHTEAKRKGLTKEDSRKILQRVRQMDDSNC